MSTVAVTRLVEAPVAEVWRVFTDLPRRCEWLSAVTEVELMTPGPFGRGTVWRETRHDGRRRARSPRSSGYASAWSRRGSWSTRRASAPTTG